MPTVKQEVTQHNQKLIIDSINIGKQVLENGGSKADAARAIYEMIKDEPREVIIKAFIDGATVTEKGSPTYFYNIRRQFDRKQREDVKEKSKTKKKSE